MVSVTNGLVVCVHQCVNRDVCVECVCSRTSVDVTLAMWVPTVPYNASVMDTRIVRDPTSLTFVPSAITTLW